MGNRHYLTAQGKACTELMLFENYDGGIDCYMRVSSWEVDLWSLYKIEDQSMPEDWHKAKTMQWINNAIWPMDALPDKKRKLETMEMETIVEPGEEAMSSEADIYQTALHAMTPIATDSPKSPPGLLCDAQL